MNRGYTDLEVRAMEKAYLANPSMNTVHDLAVKLRKTKMSVILKLVSLGIYKKKVYLTKLGELPVKKAQMVSEIERLLTLEKDSLKGLDLVRKDVLRKLTETLGDRLSELENLLQQD